MRISTLKLSIFLAFAILANACGIRGTGQEHQQTPGKQEELNNSKISKNPKTAWVEYEPAVVELEGKLSVRTFFGPPNFGENPKTDSKETSWILFLDKPINVRAKDETDTILGPSEENVRELQLVTPEPLNELLGKKVRVEGTLFHAHTGHHHTNVLLDVASISLAEPD